MKKATKIISFSSSKGGVGRTMTLSNCAKIYSKGKDWAGIESSITLLVDFDFHAPGIQYYDFLLDDVSKQYDIFKSKFHTYKELQSELNQNKIGIAFLLSKIVNNNEYLKQCEQLLKIKEINSEKAVVDFQNYVLKDLFTQDDYNPLRHLNKLKYESLFIIPAGSPKNK
jgi:cellulose biosynthesis protein BcsQ